MFNKKLRVLVTRPAHQANQLGRLIEQQGGQAILLPTIAIEFIEADLTKLLQQDMAIFISPNAVQATQRLMQKQGIVWPKQIMIAAVGASTAQALSAAGLPATVVPEQFNSEGLLALPALQNIGGKRIIIFRGDGGRELLSTILQQRSAVLTEVVIYRRTLPVMDIKQQLSGWQTGGLDIIVVTSNTGLQNLLTIIGEAARNWLLNMPLLVISERMAQFARELGFVKKPLVADNATDAAIVQALLKYTS